MVFIFASWRPSTSPSRIRSKPAGTYLSKRAFNSCNSLAGRPKKHRIINNVENENSKRVSNTKYSTPFNLKLNFIRKQIQCETYCPSSGPKTACSRDPWGRRTPYHNERRWLETRTAGHQPVAQVGIRYQQHAWQTT